jgi:hypothetical protein
MNKHLEKHYRDLHISIEATQTQAGWYWSYLIDGRVQAVGSLGLLPTAAIALRQGSTAAQARVDELKRIGWR